MIEKLNIFKRLKEAEEKINFLQTQIDNLTKFNSEVIKNINQSLLGDFNSNEVDTINNSNKDKEEKTRKNNQDNYQKDLSDLLGWGDE